VKRRETRVWLARGAITAALLMPLLLWLSGCWLFNVPPVAGFTISAQTGQAPLTINFSAVPSIDEDGAIVKFEWDFGDGTSGTGENVSHTYGAAGTFVVVLRVTDDGGDAATAQKTIYVLPAEPPGPAASFTASPASGTSPLTVSFNASASTYEDGTISWYEWDFGDGAVGYGRTTVHTYFSSGAHAFTATLTVYGADGKTGTATRSVAVTTAGGGTPAAGAPSARFVILFDDPAPVEYTNHDVAPVRVWLDPTDSEADEDQTIAHYQWIYGDGASEGRISPDIVNHTYWTANPSEVFSITLLVIDDDGRSDDITKTVRVENYQPVAGFEVYSILSPNTVAGPVEGPGKIPDGGDWWTDEDPDVDGNDGRVTYEGVVQTDSVTVWIRSQEIIDNDWLDMDRDDPNPNGENDEPDEYDTEDDPDNMCFDPEGQTWEALGPPDWFPNRAWGIKQLRINWGDGNIDVIVFDDDYDTLAEHDYDFSAGGVASWTITVTAIDYLGAEGAFSRVITFNEGGGP